MTQEEFLAEVKSSKICPNYFERIYSEFNIFQKDTLKTLQEVHKVCETNNVLYEVAYGSLLGLVRDGGQIPWDYDVDIIVPYNQKGKLIQALKNDLNPNYYFYCPDTNPKCRHMIMRIAPNEYRTEALHVDVFFLTGTPDDKTERELFAAKIRDISNKRFGKLVNIKEESVGDYRRYAKLLIKNKIPSLFSPLKRLMSEYDRLCSKYDPMKSDYCISADTSAQWCYYQSEIMWSTKLIQMSVGEFRIPTRYDELLRTMYGNYMEIPPLEDRIREVLYNHKRITTFQAFQH